MSFGFWLRWTFSTLWEDCLRVYELNKAAIGFRPGSVKEWPEHTDLLISHADLTDIVSKSYRQPVERFCWESWVQFLDQILNEAEEKRSTQITKMVSSLHERNGVAFMIFFIIVTFLVEASKFKFLITVKGYPQIYSHRE